jgi:hypothetical protein
MEGFASVFQEGQSTKFRRRYPLSQFGCSHVQSENYTDNVNDELSQELYIKPQPDTHGTEGYVHVSYPKYFFNQSRKIVLIDLKLLCQLTVWRSCSGRSKGT